MSGVFGDASNIFNDNSRTLAPEAVASQVLLMSVISLVTIVLFNLLRPKNKIIYEPKVKYHEGDKPPPRISDSLFGWLPPLVNTKEPELLDKIGLDAVTFLRFVRLMRWLFTACSILAAGALIPINVTYNLKHIKSNKRDILSMMTIRDVSGEFLYAHVIVTYLITFVIIVFVDINWRAMIRLRHQWFRSPEYLQSFYARTLQVRHVPKKYQNDEGLKAIFDTVKVPYPTTSVHIGRKVGELPQLIEMHNDTVREFEQVLVKYLKGGKIRSKRPTIRDGGCCGMGGTKRDAIDFYTYRLKKMEQKIESVRNEIDTKKAENYGFASMAAVPYAHIVAKFLSNKSPKGTEIGLAPNPKDIIWKNMNESAADLAHKRLLGFIWLFFICFFNTIPLFALSFLANLDSIKSYVPFLQTWFEKNKTSFTIVSGVLPPAISGIFGFFLPLIMRWLTKFMGALTHSRLDRAVIARYFAFLVISQLIIFTLIGVIFMSAAEIIAAIGQKSSFKEILQNMNKLPDIIHRTYINQASYWLTFFPLRGFLVVFDLAQIINLVWLSFKTHIFGRTPRDIRDWTKPPDFQYAIYYSNLLFMGSVGLVFAPLAPLVVIAATIVFWLSSWVYKYQLMFVFVSKVESGGRIWNVVINRLLFCVVLMQLLMILTIGLQFRFTSYQWVSTIPPILFVLFYKVYINKVYLPKFNYFNPSEEEIRLAKVYSERADHKGNKLEKRFGHPALHAELYTPMLHKKMMPLLAQVYDGKINHEQANLGEYGGQKMEAQIMPGGIRIAAIDQSDLEYDPALYQRDRGEADWDTRSISTMAMGSTMTGSTFFNGGKYDRYLNHGPAGHQEYEMGKLDSMEEPLLSPRSMALQQQGFSSQQTLIPPMRSYSPSPGSVSTDTLVGAGPGSTQSHQRPASGYLLGGQPPRSESPSLHSYPPQHARQGSGNVLANPQHARQASGNVLAGPQHGRQPSGNVLQQRAGSPGPYQAYGQQQQQQQQQSYGQHGRTTSGNVLADGRQSPGPYQAYGQQAPPGGRQLPGPYQAYAQQGPPPGGRQSPGPYPAYGQQPVHQRQMSGNPLADTGRQSPGPFNAYQPNQPPPQHQRQISGNPLATAGRQSPGPFAAYAPQPPQQHQRQASGNALAGYGSGRSASPGPGQAYGGQQYQGPPPTNPRGGYR